MPRRKVKKAGKAKRSTAGKGNTTTSYGTLEKTFKDLPGKIAIQSRKALGVLKQKEKKLVAQLKKATTQKTTATKTGTTLASKYKTNPTAAVKKQIANNKTGVTKATGTVKDLTGQLTALKTQIKTQTNHAGKYGSMGKHISEHHKTWDAKNTTTTTKATGTTGKRKTKKTRTTTGTGTNSSGTGSNYSTYDNTKSDTEVTE